MVLLIDNYDSFTWNLAHRLGEVGAVVRVARNDTITIAEIERLAPDHLVISPGPGRPESAGISIDVIRRFGPHVPTLGVCLGHQAIAIACGGRVERGAVPMHGKMSLVAHDGTHLFAGLTSPIEAGRYHSLVIPPDGVPPGFRVCASIVHEGTVMAIRHETWPLFGVQFHPESVMTSVGHRILQNFLERHVH